MLPVEILAIQGSLVLRARGSELLILSHHVSELKVKTQPKDFTQYFLESALLNRPARKLFEAWLRKDNGLWQRLYKTVQTEIKASEDESAAPAPKVEKKSPVTKALASEADDAEEAADEAAPKAKTKAVAAKKTVTKDAKSETKKVVAKKTTTKEAKAEPKKAATKKTTTTKKADTKKTSSKKKG